MHPHDLSTLVEHRRAWTLEKAELNLYETYQEAFEVPLSFTDPVLTSMISGKKIMHLPNKKPFEFVPGQALIMPSRERMKIDFPGANEAAPTRCLALVISDEFIRETTQQFNQSPPRLEPTDQWDLDDQNFHFTQSPDITGTLQRIITLFREDHVAKDFFATNALQELVLRIMQTQARHLLIDRCREFLTNHRLAYAVNYIRDHLDRPIKVEDLCEKACLSKSQFFRAFKQEFGITPVDFVNRERIERAKRILAHPHKTVTDTCFECGFNSLSYFSRVFRKWAHCSPGQFQQRLHAQNALMD